MAVELPDFGEELDGYPMLRRTLAKARATLAGTADGFTFGCPVDHTLMARLGVDPPALLDLAGRFEDDRDVLDALRARGIPPAADAWFDAHAVEDEVAGADGVYLRVRAAGDLPAEGAARVFAGADHGAEVDVAVLDAPPGTVPAPRTGSRAEVLVVVDGAALVTLGDHQARIVRAGEVVRVPAGRLWRWAVSGEVALRAVLVTVAGG